MIQPPQREVTPGALALVLALLAISVLPDLTGHFYWAFAVLTAVAFAGMASWVFLIGRIEQVDWRGTRHAARARAVSA